MMSQLQWVVIGLSLLISSGLGTAVIAQEPLPRRESKTLQEFDLSESTSSDPLTEQVEERAVTSDYELLFLPDNSGGENGSTSWKYFPESLDPIASDINQTYERRIVYPVYVSPTQPLTPPDQNLAVVLRDQGETGIR